MGARYSRLLSGTVAALALVLSQGVKADMWTGTNVKMSQEAPWGSHDAEQSLHQLANAGAHQALLVAFLWQDNVGSNTPHLGQSDSPEQIRAGLRQMRNAGLSPVLKLHLWIPGHWAGEAQPTDTTRWFSAYQEAVQPLLDVAEQEHATAVVLGTELRGVEDSNQWPALVSFARGHYHGPLVYVTDGLRQANSFRWWSLFDVIGTSLYPALLEDGEQRQAIMTAAAEQLKALGLRERRPVWVAEVGMRSSDSSLAAPWESPEQRPGKVALELQQSVLQQWQQTLRRAGVSGMAVWCWYTNPKAGGPHDTDFTPQGKPAIVIFK